MKKVLAILSALILVCSVTGCAAKKVKDKTGGSETEEKTTVSEAEAESESEAETEAERQTIPCLYGCPPSKRTAKLQMKKKKYLG